MPGLPWDVGTPPGMTAVRAPLQAIITSIAVSDGDQVAAGDQLMVLESMKMEHEVRATRSGVVHAVAVPVGATVDAGVTLLLLAESGDEGTDASAGPSIPPGHISADLAEVLQRHSRVRDARGPEVVEPRHAGGSRTARENIADLVDDGSFVEYRALAIAAQRRGRSLEDLIARTPADGLATGTGRRVAVMAYDYSVLAGTQGVLTHRKTDRLLELADRERLPVVMFAEGGGGRPGDTDTTAVAQLDLPTFRLAARLSGKVPLIAVVTGYCFAGNAALASACDVIVATADASLGMGGPAMIEGGGLGTVPPGDVGPMSVQVPNGVVDVLVDDEAG